MCVIVIVTVTLTVSDSVTVCVCVCVCVEVRRHSRFWWSVWVVVHMCEDTVSTTTQLRIA